MKRVILLVLSLCFVGVTSLVYAENPPDVRPSIKTFDDDVAICRRIVRQYCAIVQQMMSSATVNQTQQADGLKLLAEASQKWTDLQSKYASNPPQEYAGDKMFKARLRDFGNALEDMKISLTNGDARRSFLACGFGCKLFVSMHEDNGLDYALDKLFHLRADIKTTQSVMKTQGLEGVRVRLPGLLLKRDAVLLAPPPFLPENEEFTPYFASLDELSRAMDRLALAVAAQDTKEVEKILANGLMLVNKPYGIAL